MMTLIARVVNIVSLSEGFGWKSCYLEFVDVFVLASRWSLYFFPHQSSAIECCLRIPVWSHYIRGLQLDSANDLNSS